MFFTIMRQTDFLSSALLGGTNGRLPSY